MSLSHSDIDPLRDVPRMREIFIDLESRASSAFEREMSERAANARYFAVVPELDALPSEPRFKEMLKRLNLPE